MCLIDYLLVFTQKFFIIKRRKDYESGGIRNCSRVGDNEVLQQQTYIHCILEKNISQLHHHLPNAYESVFKL